NSVTRRPGEPASEVIALLAPGLRVKPAVISDEAPLMGDTVSLLGYRRGPDLLTEGLQTKVGQVTEVTRVDDVRRGASRKAHIEVDIRIEGGSRGGAMMDGLGAVCGIAFDFTRNAGRGKFFEIESVRRWIDMYVPTAQIDEVDLSTVRDQDLEPRTRSAVVPVFIWAEREEGTSDTFSQVANSSTASGGLYIRDPWCLNCSGTGVVQCLNCSNGIVSRKTRTQVGVNQVTGQPIYGNKVLREACPNCSGRGGFDCKQCTQGKINFARTR
ncbi:MAG: trypsin-like peptidase domain-containing protein, partial [Planctomycetota bacterium]